MLSFFLSQFDLRNLTLVFLFAAIICCVGMVFSRCSFPSNSSLQTPLQRFLKSSITATGTIFASIAISLIIANKSNLTVQLSIASFPLSLLLIVIELPCIYLLLRWTANLRLEEIILKQSMLVCSLEARESIFTGASIIHRFCPPNTGVHVPYHLIESKLNVRNSSNRDIRRKFSILMWRSRLLRLFGFFLIFISLFGLALKSNP